MRVSFSVLSLSGRVMLMTRANFAVMKASVAPCEKARVIVITGPTAVGKSSVAIALAQRLNGEIISADSVQVYQGLDVGSAKTPVAERQNVPHHLLDVVPPTEEYSAGAYYLDAREATKKVLTRGRVPIVVGGAGMYLRWYLHGKPDTPKPTAEQAAAVDAEIVVLQSGGGGWDAAVKYLSEAGDSETAHRLARNDWYRLRRSLEIVKITGRPQSSFPVPWITGKSVLVDGSESMDTLGLEQTVSEGSELDFDFQSYFLCTDRVELYRRIDLRCEQMLTDTRGLLSEASWLLDLGMLPNSSSPSRAIGYRQTMEYLLKCRMSGGATTAAEFLEYLQEFQKASRNYAKRQLTWFRGENIFRQLDCSASQEELVGFLEQQYHTPSGKSLPMIDSDQSRSDQKLRKALKTYVPENRIFTDASSCSNVVHWITRTQGGRSSTTST